MDVDEKIVVSKEGKLLMPSGSVKAENLKPPFATAAQPPLTPENTIRTVEWNMMNKQKFYPLSILSSFTIRCFLYPFSVIKTRIQVQRGNENYSGTIDAFKKILKYEGVGGLYKGFWINTFQIVSSVFYVTTYENVRHFMLARDFTDSRVRALVAGGCASAVGQTFIVPCDVVSQHLMVLGQLEKRKGGTVVVNPLNLDYKKYKSKFDLTVAIGKRVYERDGVLGFYRGYWASLCTYVPTSAMWWSFYQLYQDWLFLVMPPSVPTLAIQSMAAPLGGLTTTIITNPLDIVRARLQVQRLNSVSGAFVALWQEEKLGIFTKGLSARVAQSCVFSFAIILGYESVKRMSVLDEYRDRVRR
ncbi:unnamed protein product [Notodromas monacha]|uniref:Solute carrier family 25 member 44 n=1 Tax=Notodromas monacha TaxID=399045 RepID=A0A7R9BJ18_9CRUS|nr:unnamed protein product [Notodromas monacha]CAG0915537.1 unnamed protein product [Notodromas monacha]